MDALRGRAEECIRSESRWAFSFFRFLSVSTWLLEFSIKEALSPTVSLLFFRLSEYTKSRLLYNILS
jgi:hypothetical protein